MSNSNVEMLKCCRFETKRWPTFDIVLATFHRANVARANQITVQKCPSYNHQSSQSRACNNVNNDNNNHHHTDHNLAHVETMTEV
jgi:hypothetical protein